MQIITKKELMAIGYGSTFASNIIRLAKLNLVEKGYVFYDSKRLGKVPLEVVEEILGTSIEEELKKIEGIPVNE